MPPELGLEVDAQQSGCTVLTVSGEVDVYSAPLLRQKLLDLAMAGPPRVVVNLEPVGFLDSTGLGVLVAGLNRFRRQGGELELICSQSRILRLFEITGLTRVLTIYPSLDAALATVSA
ncbi:MAG: STAS domain-containing protein [Acidimicrobiales bacterium]